MVQATFSVRMDEGLKRQFEALCSDLGMTASTAVSAFARAVVRERRLPLEVVSPNSEVIRERAMEAFYALREEARRNGLQDMTLDEINEEIRLTRLTMDA